MDKKRCFEQKMRKVSRYFSSANFCSNCLFFCLKMLSYWDRLFYLCELVFRPIKVFELILKIDWFPVRQNFKKYKVWNIYSDCNRQPFKVAWKKFDVFTASLYFMRGAGIVSYSIHIKVGLLIMRITDIITSNGRGKWKL